MVGQNVARLSAVKRAQKIGFNKVEEDLSGVRAVRCHPVYPGSFCTVSYNVEFSSDHPVITSFLNKGFRTQSLRPHFSENGFETLRIRLEA